MRPIEWGSVSMVLPQSFLPLRLLLAVAVTFPISSWAFNKIVKLYFCLLCLLTFSFDVGNKEHINVSLPGNHDE